MPDEATTQETQTQEQPSVEGQQQQQQSNQQTDTQERNWRNLEAKSNTNETKANKLFGVALQNAAAAIPGLDVNEGMGKLLFQSYAQQAAADFSQNDEAVPTAESFKQFAEQHGFDPGTTQEARRTEQDMQKLQENASWLRNNSTQPQQRTEADDLKDKFDQGKFSGAGGTIDTKLRGQLKDMGILT